MALRALIQLNHPGQPGPNCLLHIQVMLVRGRPRFSTWLTWGKGGDTLRPERTPPELVWNLMWNLTEHGSGQLRHGRTRWGHAALTPSQ